MSLDQNLDLIQITEKVDPPICKIGDYGKYLYQLKKKEKKRTQHKRSEVKGVRLKFNTSSHDIETKAKQAYKFLEQGNKVKLELRLRGREKALRAHIEEQINKFLTFLKELTTIEIDQPSKRQHTGVSLIIKKGTKEAATPEQKNEK